MARKKRLSALVRARVSEMERASLSVEMEGGWDGARGRRGVNCQGRQMGRVRVKTAENGDAAGPGGGLGLATNRCADLSACGVSAAAALAGDSGGVPAAVES